MYNKKVCILGARGVGKTSLIERFLSGSFSEVYRTGTGANIDKVEVDVDRDKLQLMLWDIHGEDQQASRGYLNYLKGASAFIYVVDGTRIETLATANKLRQETAKHLGSVKPSIMLFNKADLVSQWKISPEIISNVESNGIFARLTSCREDSGVDTAFGLLARVMMGRTALMPVMPIPVSKQGFDVKPDLRP